MSALRAFFKKCADCHDKMITIEEKLLSEIKSLPSDIRLTPCRFKQPILKQWQKLENTYSPQELIEEIDYTNWFKFQATGYAVVCGEYQRRYLIAIDCDRQYAIDELQLMQLPKSVSFSSGKAGRHQVLYYLNKKIPNNKIKKINLEIRGQGHCSILPPSLHPETKRYYWKLDPKNHSIATIDADYLEHKINILKNKYQTRTSPNNKNVYYLQNEDVNTIDRAKYLLSKIDGKYAQDYWDWISIGMSLWGISPTLLSDWDEWSKQGASYKPGECQYKWKSFSKVGYTIATLYYYAYK